MCLLHAIVKVCVDSMFLFFSHGFVTYINFNICTALLATNGSCRQMSCDMGVARKHERKYGGRVAKRSFEVDILIRGA